MLRDGKEIPTPSVCVMADEYFKALGMMPWFDIQALHENSIVDPYDVGGWLPGSVTLE